MEPQKRLVRSESQRMIAGVCGGLGEFFGLDPTLVRLAFVVLGLFGGGGIIAYLIMWLIVPTESKAAASPREVPRQGLGEMREGVERGAQGARGAYRRWRGGPGTGASQGGQTAPPGGQTAPPGGQAPPPGEQAPPPDDIPGPPGQPPRG